MSRLAPEEQDAAGSPATPVPPSLPPSLLHPPPAWLALLFEFLQCDKKRSKQKGKGPRPRCTKHPPGTSSVAFSVRSIQFSILQKKKKKALREKPWQIL